MKVDKIFWFVMIINALLVTFIVFMFVIKFIEMDTYRDYYNRAYDIAERCINDAEIIIEQRNQCVHALNQERKTDLYINIDDIDKTNATIICSKEK